MQILFCDGCGIEITNATSDTVRPSRREDLIVCFGCAQMLQDAIGQALAILRTTALRHPPTMPTARELRARWMAERPILALSAQGRVGSTTDTERGQ